MNLAFKHRTLDMKTKQAKQEMVLLAGLHAVSHDFSGEFPCLGIRVISVQIGLKYREKQSE